MKRGATKEYRCPIFDKRIIISLIVIALALSLYFTFFNISSCNTITCFNKALVKCSKVKFVNIQEEATWIYTIKGSKDNKCVVQVRSIDVNLDEAKKIENKDMLCYIPKGMVILPESELDNCHGLLKEGLQDIIIEKLHVYIVQNIGKISEEATKPL